MTQLLEILSELGQRDAIGPFLIGSTGLGILHSAAALGRTRQWYMLPVVFGLTALVGFLLNPFADSNSLLDLKTRLTSYETLTLLCIVQFGLVSLSALLGLQLDGRRNQERGAVRLAIVSVVPAPAIVVAMLLMEQAALSGSANARPETVGRDVGLFVACVLTLSAAVAMCLPTRRLAAPHMALSAAMILACMFVPFFQDPLPQPMAVIDWQSLKLLAFVAPVAAATVSIGFAATRQDRRQVPN